MRSKLVGALLLVVASGCGDDGGATDAGPTPQMDTGVARSCGIEIEEGGIFLSRFGSKVLFSHLDGSIIGTEATDANGLASRDDCDDETLITVMSSRSGSPVGFTVQVSVGMTAFIGQAPTTPALPHVLDITPSTTGLPGAAITNFVSAGSDSLNYQLGGTEAMTSVFPRDLGKDPANVTVFAMARSADAIVGYDYKKAVAAMEASPVVLDGWEDATVDGIEVSVTDVPTDISFGKILVTMFVDGTQLNTQDSGNILDLGTSLAASHSLLPGFADAMQATAMLSYDLSTSVEAVHCVMPTTNFVAIDGANLPAPLQAVSADRTMGQRHHISWTTTNTGATYTTLDILWDRPGGVGEWFVLVPGSATSFVSPELPADFVELEHNASIDYARIDVRHEHLSYADYSAVLADVPTFQFQFEACHGIPATETQYTSFGSYVLP